jgi:hypothetical protein
MSSTGVTATAVTASPPARRRRARRGFASPGGALPDAPRVYAAPAGLRLNRWALAGDWTVGREAAVLNEAGGRLAYAFHARDLHLVMGPAAGDAPVRIRVRLDGRPPGAAHGADVDDQGDGAVTAPRLYQLIRQPKPIADRRFEIEFLDPGVAAVAPGRDRRRPAGAARGRELARTIKRLRCIGAGPHEPGGAPVAPAGRRTR